MKTKLFLFALAGLIFLGFNSCDKEKLAIDIDHTLRIQSFDLDTVPFTGDVTLGPFPVQNDLDSILTAKNADKNKIQKVTLKEMKLLIQTPDTANFNPFVDVEAFISGDGLSEKLMASVIDHPNDGLKELALTPTTDDMKDYILKNPLSLRVRLKTDEPIRSKLNIKITPKFTIKVGLLD